MPTAPEQHKGHRAVGLPRHGAKAAFEVKGRERGTTTERGYGYKWQQLRKRILQRDDFICQICFGADATDVDHITPKAKGGTNSPSNLQSLCKACHKHKTAHEDSKAKP